MFHVIIHFISNESSHSNMTNISNWKQYPPQDIWSCLHTVQVHRDHSLNTRHPEGFKKNNQKNTLSFWMMPSMIGCDGSQQGRQSGGQTHNTSIVTLSFYTREGGGGGGAERGEEWDFFFQLCRVEFTHR